VNPSFGTGESSSFKSIRLRVAVKSINHCLALGERCNNGCNTPLFTRRGKNGGAEEIRTPDPHVANVVLYQLSYRPISTLNNQRRIKIMPL